MKKGSIGLEKLLFAMNLIKSLLILNLVPLAICLIHQVILEVQEVMFFGIVLSGGFIYDLGILILFIFLNSLIVLIEVLEYFIIKLIKEKGGDK